jgi:hypothetical protein
MEKLHNNLIAYTLQGPGIQPIDKTSSVTKLESIFSSVIGILTIVGVIYFVIQIILAGYSLIASHGDPKELQTGTKRLTNGVMGLAIVALAYGLGALISNLLGINDVFDLTKIFKPF